MTVVRTPGVRRFGNDDSAQTGQAVGEPRPYPPCDVLTGRVLQPFYVIQVVVVKFRQMRLKGTANVGKVDHPPGRFIHEPSKTYLHTKRVSVEATASMVLWHVGQPMCCVKPKCLVDFQLLPARSAVADYLS